MSQEHGSFSDKRAEFKLIGILLIALALSLAFFFNDELINRLFGGLPTEPSKKTIVGEISLIENDTRHKDSTSIAWQKAQSAQKIRVGDGVFTGEDSKARVTLTSGGHVDLDQNTMVMFNEIAGMKLPNFTSGNFRLAVNGKMNAAIRGQVTEIEGKNSEVQLFIGADQKPQLRLLKGDVTVKPKGKPASRLALQKFVSFSEAPPMKAVDHQPASLPTPVTPSVGTVTDSDVINYTYRLYDIYERTTAERLKLRRSPKDRFPFSHEVRFQKEGSVSQVFGQHSRSKEFTEPLVLFQGDNSAVLNEVFDGENNWRVSVDGKTWSEPAQFFVQTSNLKSAVPSLHASTELPLLLLKNEVFAKIEIQSEEHYYGYVLEVSESREFPANTTRVHLIKKTFSLRFTKPGVYYYRVRGVDEKTQLSDYSRRLSVHIQRPTLPATPSLAARSYQTLAGESLRLSWKDDPKAKVFEIQLNDQRGKVVHKRTVVNPHTDLVTERPGIYTANVTSIDSWGRRSSPAKAPVTVDRRKEPTLIKKYVSESLPEKRAPTSVAASSVKLSVAPPPALNLNYPSSKIEFEGAGFTMYSKEEINAGRSQPTAFLAGLRSHYWLGANGLEGSLKAKALNVNSEAKGTAPLQVEGRYLRRFHIPFNPFSPGGTQFSLIAGYEIYRNLGSGLFAPKYDLMKTGFALSFPAWSRWDTGGEVLFGYGLDNSKKYEISGHLHYYLQKTWSMGVGYRLHLFEAGSDASSPLGLPYREASGEGYSVIRWHY